MRSKKITICASSVFIEEANQWKKYLEERGYKVIKTPKVLESNYKRIHKLHYRRISESDIIFVLNLNIACAGFLVRFLKNPERAGFVFEFF